MRAAADDAGVGDRVPPVPRWGGTLPDSGSDGESCVIIAAGDGQNKSGRGQGRRDLLYTTIRISLRAMPAGAQRAKVKQ